MHTAIGYIDPGAGSLLMQTLVAGFGGIMVFLQYLWSTYLGRRKTHEHVDVTPDSGILR